MCNVREILGNHFYRALNLGRLVSCDLLYRLIRDRFDQPVAEGRQR